MPLTIKDLFERALTILHDQGAQRWTPQELLRWVNEAAARICIAKPNACTTPTNIALAAGSEQALPSVATTLVRPLWAVVGAGAKQSVTVVSREKIDVIHPAWHSMSATALPDHVIYDPADPETFHVYPPSLGTATLHAILTVPPVAIAEPASPHLVASYAAIALPIGDQFQGSLLDYLLYRAFSKDANLPGSAQRAMSHFQAFQVAIGEKIQRDMTTAPGTAHALPKT